MKLFTLVRSGPSVLLDYDRYLEQFASETPVILERSAERVDVLGGTDIVIRLIGRNLEVSDQRLTRGVVTRLEVRSPKDALVAQIEPGDNVGAALLQQILAGTFSLRSTALRPIKFLGGTGREILTTGSGDDILYGEDGNDVLKGGIGDDTLHGERGADILNGGVDIDTASYIEARSGVLARLDGGPGTGDAKGDVFVDIESLVGSNFDDVLVGDKERNFLFGSGGNDVLEGGLGKDVLTGGDGIDIASYFQAKSGLVLDLLAPGRTLSPEAKGDSWLTIEAWRGSTKGDTLKGRSKEDIFYGEAGNDVLDGRGGDDRLFGEKGDDRMLSGPGADRYDGGPGKDSVDYSNVLALSLTIDMTNPNASTGFAKGDQFRDVETIIGGALFDRIIGTTGPQTLKGGLGFDTLTGGPGADVLDGGPDGGAADYGTSKQGLTVSFADPTRNTGDAKGDSFVQIKSVFGSAFGDTLVAGDAIDDPSALFGLYGQGGLDTLIGGPGRDYLDVTKGKVETDADILRGGPGNDFYRIDGGSDQVTELAGAGSDKVEILYIAGDVAIPNVEGLRVAPGMIGKTVDATLGLGQVTFGPEFDAPTIKVDATTNLLVSNDGGVERYIFTPTGGKGGSTLFEEMGAGDTLDLRAFGVQEVVEFGETVDTADGDRLFAILPGGAVNYDDDGDKLTDITLSVSSSALSLRIVSLKGGTVATFGNLGENAGDLFNSEILF